MTQTPATSTSSERIKFILYSRINKHTVAEKAGKPEYSYYAILKSYLPILEAIGEIEIVYDPATEVDIIYEACRQAGRPCVFLHFSAPQNYIAGIKCPTMHVIAWEYSTIPTDTWDNDGYQDWRTALSQCVGVVSISAYTVETVRAVMGKDYPAVSIPCPVWDRLERFRGRASIAEPRKSYTLYFNGVLIDSRAMDLHFELPSAEEIEERYRRDDEEMLTMKNTQERLREREIAFYKNIEHEWEHMKGGRVNFAIEDDKTLAQRHREWREKRLAGRRAPIARLKILAALAGRFCLDALAVILPRATTSEIAAFRRFEDRVRIVLAHQTLPPEAYAITDMARARADQIRTETEAAREAEIAAAAALAKQQRESDAVVRNAVYLDGYVYTAIINPYDKRKNWQDMVVAFCWAFHDVADATLVLKLTATHVVEFSDELVIYLKRLSPFKCRVVAIDAFLDDEAYEQLIEGGTYYVNTSYGEGQSIPLTEAMSCGAPAVAPTHTAMRDYVADDAAFVFKTNAVLTSWQHDPRRAFRCTHYRPDWTALVNAYRRSYETAKSDPKRYAEMGRNASRRLKDYCSLERTTADFHAFIDRHLDLFDHSHGRSAKAAADAP